MIKKIVFYSEMLLRFHLAFLHDSVISPSCFLFHSSCSNFFLDSPSFGVRSVWMEYFRNGNFGTIAGEFSSFWTANPGSPAYNFDETSVRTQK